MGEGLMLPCPKIMRGQWWLTPEQEAYAREFARTRMAAMLSTTPIDEQEAEQYLRDAYRVAGMKPPARIRWFDSPLSFVGASVEDCVWDCVGASVGSRARENLKASVLTIVETSMGASVETSMLVIVGASVGLSVGERAGQRRGQRSGEHAEESECQCVGLQWCWLACLLPILP